MERQQKLRLAFQIFVAGLFVFVVLFAAEIALSLTAPRKPEPPSVMKPYAEFTKQYLHPFYFFFFPQEQAILDQINNPTVSIDRRGFRGALPEERGSRKLAFLIGGSVAFGHGATSNHTTITGYLNGIQSEYLFVNAGVPSFVSTQEWSRLSLELLDYKPELIIALDGFNDAVTAAGFYEAGLPYPPGTNESFEGLAQRFNNIREQKLVDLNRSRFSKMLLFHVRQKLKQIFVKSPKDETADQTQITDGQKSASTAAAQAYLRNLTLMKDLAVSRGTRFTAIYQPWLYAHKNIAPTEEQINGQNHAQSNFIKYFHEEVFKSNHQGLTLLDFSNIFDGNSAIIKDRFLDQVHFSDEGNEIVAKEIITSLNN